MEYKYIIIILFLIFASQRVNNSEFINYYFNFKLVDETMKPGTFISPTISEDGYLYIVTGHDEDLKNNESQRYIIKYDIETSSLVEQYHYNLSYGFYAGEAYAFNDRSQYIFSSSFSEANNSHNYEVRHLNSYGINWQDDSIYGFRRFFKQAGSFFYFFHFDENDYLYLKKIAIAYYINYIPYFEIIKEDRSNKMRFTSMISCDSTKDNNYFLCSYFGEDEKAIIIAIDNNLNIVNHTVDGEHLESKFKDGFIKIIRLKGNSVFIMMNSIDNKTTRLRYINFVSETIKDQLYPIIKNDHLDIEHTQTNANYGCNDIIALNSEKVIKIFGNDVSNNVIITIIQFYDDDTSMSIKIYNMINENNFKNFKQSRISLLKNSFVFCNSAEKNGVRRPGYFIINYPNSKDGKLETDRILVNNWITLENKLFLVNLKFKILDIPKDFKLVSKSQSKEISNNEEYESDDEIILKQYRIKEGPYILHYQSIARGYDFGYSYLIKYPEDKILKNDEILLEGRHGNITIDFNQCLDGYNNFDFDVNLCSNEKPKNYYLDKNEKMYKECPSSCEECQAPEGEKVNCLVCKNNFYLTEDTNACLEQNVDGYIYIPETKKLAKCHKNCLKCSSRPIDDTHQKCSKCPKNSYLTIDTDSCYDKVPDNYYLDENANKLKRCYSSCLSCIGPAYDKSMNCLSCISDEYFYRKDIKNCTKESEFKKRENLSFEMANNYNYFFFVSIFILALIIYLVIHLYYKLKRKGIIKGAKQINTGVKEEDYLKKSKTMVPKKNSNNPLMTELINKGSKNNDKIEND